MKTIHFILVFMVLGLCVSCRGKVPKNQSKKSTYFESGDYLLQQRILNSSKILYSYINHGKYAFSGSNSGKFLLDATEDVDRSKDIKDLLPFYYTKIDLDFNIIEAIELVDTGQTFDEEMYEVIDNGITYKIKRYYSKRGSDLVLFYIYHNLTETKDSIFFEKLTVDGFGIELPGKIGFKKGNITVEEDSFRFVSKLKLRILNQYPLWEMMRARNSIDVSNNKIEFTGEDQIDLPPLSLVYSFEIRLIPDDLSQKQRISDYGVFKRAK